MLAISELISHHSILVHDSISFFENAKKCQSVRPSFDKVASSKPNLIFVDVPVTNTNVQLHKGLGVKSVPYAHIYCPENGLVVEEKISRSRFAEFEKLVEKHSS